MNRRTFKPADFAEQTAFVRTHCNLCPRQLGCTILADARPLDTTDLDYPGELVVDDLGLPSCTAFAAAVEPAADEAFPPVTARPVPAAPAASSALAAAAPASARTKPVPARPGQPIVFSGPLRGITITTRRARDGSAETTTLRLQLAGSAR